MAVELGSAYGQIILDAAGVLRGVNQAVGAMGGLEKRMGTVGGMLTTRVTLPLVGIGTAAGKMAIDMDAAMRNIQSISHQTDEEIEALADQFLDLSVDMTKTTDTATGLAEGFYDIQGSGFEGAAAMEVLLSATKAASAGLTQTEVAAGAVTAKLNAYGEGAGEAAITSDLMFRTVDRGVGTFEELSGSLSSVVGSAANAGIGFDVVSAALSTMSKQGISFAEAGVALNQLILRLIDPGEELAGVLRSMGYESGQAALEQLGLVGTLEMLAQAGYDDTAALSPLLGNVRALRGALALTGEGAGMFAEDLEAMANAAGATEEAFAIQTKSVRAELMNLRNEAMAAGVDLAQFLLPALREGIGLARGLFEAFRALPEPVQENIVRVGLLAAAMGPALKVGSGMVGMTKELIGGTKALAGALPGLAGSIGPVVLAVGALTAAYLKWKDVQKEVAEGTEQVEGAWGDFFEEQVASGRNATEVLEAYRQKQMEVKATLDEGGVAVDLLVRDQRGLYTQTDQLNVALARVAGSFDEYVAVAREAGVESLLTANEFAALRDETTALDEIFVGITRGAEQVALAAMEAAEQVGEEGLAEAVEQVVRASMEAQDILGLVSSVLGETEMSAGQARAVMGGLGVALGEVSQAEVDLERDIRLVTLAFGEGVIGLQTFQEYMLAAREGTLELSLAQRKALTEGVNQAQATREQAEAMRELGKATREQMELELSRAEQLTGADEQRVARVALDELERAYKSGALSFEDYMTMSMEVQDTFGLVDERGRALEMGLSALTKTVTAGILPAGQYDDALKALIADADDGEVAFGELLTKVLAANEAMEAMRVVSAGPEIGPPPGAVPLGGAVGLDPGLLAALRGAGLEALIGGEMGAGGLGAGGGGAGGPTVYDPTTGRWVREGGGAGGGGAGVGQQVMIYGGLHLEGVQDAQGLLAQLQALAG